MYLFISLHWAKEVLKERNPSGTKRIMSTNEKQAEIINLEVEDGEEYETFQCLQTGDNYY
jgi:hypothetical protein